VRTSLILLPLLVCAVPAFAQPPAPQVPRQLTDPAIADRLANAVQALSQAFLDLPVGQVEAAVEGRQPTPADRATTVRDIARRDDPDFDRKLDRQIAEAKPMVRQSMKALNDALPGMIQGFQQAQKSFERALANMPDPTYPKR
jgi:hypothetical protein